MQVPSLQTVSEIERNLKVLLALEQERYKIIPELKELEKGMATESLTEQEYSHEFKKKGFPERTEFDNLKKQDCLILKSYDRLISNINKSNKEAGISEIKYSYRPGYSLIKQLNYLIEKNIPEGPIIKINTQELLSRKDIQVAKIELEQEIRAKIPQLISRIPEVTKEPAIDKLKKEQFKTSMNKMFLKGTEGTFSEGGSFRQIGDNIYILIKNYAYGILAEDEKGNKLYFVVEPKLEIAEIKTIEILKEKLFEKVSMENIEKDKILSLIEKIAKAEEIKINPEQKDKILYFLTRDMYGLEKVEPLMHDPFIEDIECDGTNVPLFIVHKKYGHIKTNVMFDKVDELRSFIVKLSQLGKAYVSFASPLLDTILPDGSRVNAVLTESVSTKGPTFTIRKFPEKPLTPIDLIKSGTINPELIAYLWTAIEFKRNILLIGPTAAGKTTLLNALAMFIPDGQRIVSIEDTRELNLLHDNWLPQVSRAGFGPPDVSGKRYGEVEMIDLMKESFRQRPDYLIVGEVRGEETNVMFQGMASGHTTLSTIHAKNLNDVVNRLITPPINLHPSLLNLIDVVIALSFAGITNPTRRVKEIDEVTQYNTVTEKMDFFKMFEWQATLNVSPEEEFISKQEAFADILPITYRSNVLKEIANEYGIENQKLLQIIKNRIAFIQELVKDDVSNYIDFKIRLRTYKKSEDF